MVKGLHRIPDMVKSLYIYIYIGCAALSLLSCFLGTTPVSASESITTNVSVEPSLTLSLSASSLALNLDPSITTFGYKDLDVIVGTNNATGYKLTMSTTSGNTNLVNTEDNTKVIETLPTLAGGYTDSTFIVNKWGYKKNRNTDNYNSFPATQTLLENNERTNEDIANLRFGTKIDYLQESGTYATNIEFNLVANPLVNYMQDLNPALCTTTPMTVVDKRDNEEYTIAKLADGNCWLLENLRLDIADPAVQAKLTAATTNATDATLGYLKNGGGSSPYPANGVIAKTASSGSWTNDYANPYIATQYEDTTQAASGSSPAGKIGIYYNYCAASAGSYCYAAGAGTGNASQDICPAGWRLPTGGASGEYQALFAAYSSNVANFQSALSTPLSGYFVSGAAYYQGLGGFFWSSTRNDGNYMYDLYVTSSPVYPQYGDGRGGGFSVRCVLK